MKDFLKMSDLSKNDIIELLDIADKLKYERKHGIEHHILKGQSLGMIFQKSPHVPAFPSKQVCISSAAAHSS